MDDTTRSDDPQAGQDPEGEDRHGTPFGLESSIPGIGVHGAEDEQVRPPSAGEQSEESATDDEAPPLV